MIGFDFIGSVLDEASFGETSISWASTKEIPGFTEFYRV